MILASLPMVISSYVVVFGDVIQSEALISDAQKYRPDEKIDYNPNRSHTIFGARNIIMSLIGPSVSGAGPLWAAMQVVVSERYKHGRKAMDSIGGGAGSFRLGTWTGYFLSPILCTVKPILGVGLASTMLIQGYVSVRIGVLKSRSFNDLGIAGVAGAILAARGAVWGLGAAIIMSLLIYLGGGFKEKAYVSQEPIFGGDLPDETIDETETKPEEE